MVLVEVFVSEPPCSGGRLLLKLINEIKKFYEGKIEVKIYKGRGEKTREYGLEVSPALIIDKDIRIIGTVPSKITLINALREAGVEMKL